MNNSISKNKNPLVSVIIPCFNHGAFLEEAVNSAINSTYKSIEIIIIDDGSTDCSFDKAQELVKNHSSKVRAFKQENAGPAVARNNAIFCAKGKYILPLDADDKISKNYIKQAVKILEADLEVKLVYCEAEKFGLKCGHWKLKPFSPESLALDNMIFVSSIFRKMDWSATGGFDERMKWGWEDWEFWINMLKNGGTVKKLESIGFYYRIHCISRRKSVNKQVKKYTIALLNEKHKAFLQQHLGGPIRNPRSWSKMINRLQPYFSLFSTHLIKENSTFLR